MKLSQRVVSLSIAFASMALAGCGASSPRSGRSTTLPTVAIGATQVGAASFYADSLAGNSTANGEPYDPRALTAAHRTLPFGTRVAVTRLDNGRRVVVRINDRGPFAGSRILDLSRAAAEALQMIRAGVVRVEVEVLSVPGVRPRRAAR